MQAKSVCMYGVCLNCNYSYKNAHELQYTCIIEWEVYSSIYYTQCLEYRQFVWRSMLEAIEGLG